MAGVAISQRPRTTFLTVLRYRATSYTWAHMNITSSLPHSHTYLCSAKFTVNITHQHDNHRTSQLIYCFAYYFVGLLVITYGATWNRATSRGLATPELYAFKAKCELNMQSLRLQTLCRIVSQRSACKNKHWYEIKHRWRWGYLKYTHTTEVCNKKFTVIEVCSTLVQLTAMMRLKTNDTIVPLLETSAVSIVNVSVEQKMVTPERRDELAFFVRWFGCRTFKRGVALVHVTYCIIQINCDCRS